MDIVKAIEAGARLEAGAKEAKALAMNIAHHMHRVRNRSTIDMHIVYYKRERLYGLITTLERITLILRRDVDNIHAIVQAIDRSELMLQQARRILDSFAGSD